MNCPKSQLKDTEVRAEGMPVTYKQLLWERRPRDWAQDNQEVISQTLPARPGVNVLMKEMLNDPYLTAPSTN